VSPARPALVSVLIVNYHAYAELSDCLRSLAPFLLDDVEVIVVDHAGEPAAAKALRDDYLWVQLLEVDRNPGFAAGVNHAARAARGEYLLLLNPDCLVDEDVVHDLARWLADHPTVGAAGALVREPDGSIQSSARSFPNVTTGFAGRTTWLSRMWPGNPWTRRNLVPAGASPEPITVDWVSGACMMVRRSAFDAVGGMDERFFLYWEDADLCRRLKSAGWPTVYYTRTGITHLTGRSSAREPTQSLVAFHRSAYLYFRKHGRYATVAAPLVFLVLYARLGLKILWSGIRD
jgi:GT2 family glycosyltransferase